MISKVKDIIEIVEEIAPQSESEKWDNPGLQVGDMNADVRCVAVALDPVIESVSKSIDKEADLLVTHHPLIFPNISLIETNRGVGKIIRLAIDNSLTIYSAHTNFDRSPNGTNLVLSEALGLIEVGPILKVEGPMSKEDFSVAVGRLPETVSLRDFAASVKDKLNSPCVRIVGDKNMKVARVAVCGGSGGDFIKRIAEAGVDAFVTGEVKYHDALLVKDMAEDGSSSMGLIEAGHFHTEEVAVSRLANIISEGASKRGFKIDVLAIEGKDPFSYIHC
ncbi:MAG: Nif3-like dinuclear metal center hexameric protein [Deltaproteobacteria bacterium]|uniref:GTP cyclohydrolase 1 type 2 homolog n=1 Tax=Candidatus Zymogenus saltonus TaxID=2844893 RepID=A0A9D8K9B3_9DELT|nr:Nif3-like dinuclear metal center hexameric protein [Candidatus Zymogenus saltonus]